MTRTALYDPDRPDLDPTGKQLELYQGLLAAVGGDYAPPFQRGKQPTKYQHNGVQDVAAWLVKQDWCEPADQLYVAQFWGGDQLREQVLERLRERHLVAAG